MSAGDGRLLASLSDDGELRFSWEGEGGARFLFALCPEAFSVEAVGAVSVGRFFAWDTFSERRRRVAKTDRLERRAGGEDKVQADYVSRNGRGRLELAARRVDDAHFIIDLSASEPAAANRVGLELRGPMAGLYGFGEYGIGPAHRRGRIVTWAEEGPVGLGAWSRWLRWTGRVPLPRGPYSTYAPAPLWLSSRGHGGWLENSERVEWLVDGDRLHARVWSRHVRLHIVGGRDLKGVLVRQRLCLGRPPAVPAWTFGPWIDAVRGEEEVRRRARLLREAGIPASALWVEDWMGSREDGRRFVMRPLAHETDTRLYPDLPGLARDLHTNGFKLLGYFCPEVAEGTRLYREALDGGHLVADTEGKPVVVEILKNRHGQWDLTREDTRAFVHQRLFAPALADGFDGWMADFGEHLPPSAVLSDGTDGMASHNRYPGLWHATNRSFFDAARPDGDSTFFVRSSSLASPALAPVFWGGDNDTDWDAADGLQTVVAQAISAGLIGHALFATEIAGYMTFGLTKPASRELFWRWTELGALLPVMRTHHGTARPRNWNFERDPETLAHFRRYARLHVLLYPYLASLAREASETGVPPVRPLALEYGDNIPNDVSQEYLLGPDVLVAPVVTPGATTRQLFAPPGRWRHWWTSETVFGPGPVRVPAPVGDLPLFVREGAVLPLAEGSREEASGGEWVPRGFVDTLAAESPGDVGADRERLTLWTPGRPAGITTILLGGGGRLTAAGAEGPAEGASVRVQPARHSEHGPAIGRSGTGVRVEPGRVVVLGDGGRFLRVSYEGPGPLEVIWRHD